jgi:glycosyltransferase involved in cell wall biosynthesis
MGGVDVMGPANKAIVSVIVPTRNRDALLRSALISVQENRGPGFELEVVVVDNGTGEETAQVAAQAGARYVRSPRSGASAARNHGIELATGDYVTFLDDDDVWTAGHLAALVDWLARQPDFVAVLGQVCNVDHDLTKSAAPWPDGLPGDGFVFPALLRIQPQVGATLVRRSAANAVGPFDEKLLGDEDWDWHLRLALHGRVGFLPVVSVLFRARPDGSDDDLQWIRFPYMTEVFWRNVRRGGTRSPSLVSTIRTYLHHLGIWHWQFIRSARAHVRAGRIKSARRSLGRAARISPLHFAWSLLRDSETRRTAAAALRSAGSSSAESSGIASVSMRSE